jgi:hypothetical protein
MFLAKGDEYVKINLSTTRYLGRQYVATQFLDLLVRYGEIYTPERWDVQQKTRHRFDHGTIPDVIKEWTRPEDWKTIFFYRKRHAEIEMSLDIKRSSHAKFNEFSAYVRDEYFKGAPQEQELLHFIIELCSIIHPVYGLIAHKKQERRQSPVLTPAERLPGIYWANLFGRPYIDFFGREKLLATPCYEVREISDDLILLLTADSPYRPEMVESDEIVTRVKEYLNHNAFAGPGFPNERCSVPQFDFSDVRWGAEEPLEESSQEKLTRIRYELEAKGYVVINEAQGQITFRAKDGSVAFVDVSTGNISLDMTGEFFKTKPDDTKEGIS